MSLNEWALSLDERVRADLTDDELKKGFEIRLLLLSIEDRLINLQDYFNELIRKDYLWVNKKSFAGAYPKVKWVKATSCINANNTTIKVNSDYEDIKSLILDVYDEAHHSTVFNDFEANNPSDRVYLVTGLIDEQHYAIFSLLRIILPEFDNTCFIKGKHPRISKWVSELGYATLSEVRQIESSIKEQKEKILN